MTLNNSKKTRILFYSSVGTKRMFSIQKFYRTDICILRDLGFEVILSNSWMDYFIFWKYDLAFIYFYRYGLMPAFLAKMLGKKVVFTGGIDYLDREYAGKKAYIIQKIFFKCCVFFSDKNILVSCSDLENIIKFKPLLNRDKFPLSFHVIDFEKYEFCKIEKKKKILCTIAWMIKEENVIRKGLDKSLYLFKKLHKLDSNFRMVIIGSKGDGTKLVNEIIRKENLENLVHFTGAISDIEKIEILKKSSVYSQLSLYEGFGIAAIEALASGNIVLHSGKGGLRDGVGVNGIVVDSENYDEVVGNVIRILANPDEHLKISRGGILHVANNFKYEKRLLEFNHILSNL